MSARTEGRGCHRSIHEASSPLGFRGIDLDCHTLCGVDESERDKERVCRWYDTSGETFRQLWASRPRRSEVRPARQERGLPELYARDRDHATSKHSYSKASSASRSQENHTACPPRWSAPLSQITSEGSSSPNLLRSSLQSHLFYGPTLHALPKDALMIRCTETTEHVPELSRLAFVQGTTPSA